MSRRLVLFLYNLLLPFGLLILVPVSIIKMRRRGGYGPHFWQRFGHFRPEVSAKLHTAPRPLWLHAVSVGEANVARKLVASLLKANPQQPCVLSVTTSTGYATAEKDAPPGLTVIYSPLDLPFIIRRVIDLIRPVRLILIEAEVWPNLVAAARRRGVPVILANARLSTRSENRYRKARALVTPIFGMLDKVCVQEAADIARWTALGVPENRIVVTGSIKYDLMGGSVKRERVDAFRMRLATLYGEPLPPIILAASTHREEELALAQILRAAAPGHAILIVPRHAERAEEVTTALQANGFTVTRRSHEPMDNARPDVFLIDTTGELRDWTALADLVIIGKSFLAHGGQNPAEAIALTIPVICGPHMENFIPLMQLLARADGITSVTGLPDLAAQLPALLQNNDAARARAQRGLRALEAHRGATLQTVAEIKNVDSTEPAPSAAPFHTSR
jgi:3-deoxy-D-manno-octulosonic-acid transferase